MSWFKEHNYKHESLLHSDCEKIIQSKDPVAIKIMLYALTLEGVIHQMVDHSPPEGVDRTSWMVAYGQWVIAPELYKEPPKGEF